MKISEVKEYLETIETLEEFLRLELHSDTRVGVQKLLKQKHSKFLKEELLHEKFEEMNTYEDALSGQVVAGIDEVGRGPLAGEVVASAVILKEKIIGLDDSKKLSKRVRFELYERIKETADYGIGIATVEEIDKYNIYEATKLAMKRAVENLNLKPEHLLIDAMVLDMGIPETKIIKGDSVSNSIAAASIIAKEERDLMMRIHNERYNGYHFDQNSGYGTKAHLDGLKKYGISPIHRKTFEPVKSMLEKDY